MKISTIRLLGISPSQENFREALQSCKIRAGVLTSLPGAELPLSVGELIPVGIEQSGFDEFVTKLLGICSLPLRSVCQPDQYMTIVSQACQEIEEPNPFFRSAEYPGFHRRMRNLLMEFDEWSLEGHLLEEHLHQLAPHLADKVTAISEIQTRVQNHLDRLGLIRPSDRLRMLVETGYPLPIQDVWVWCADRFSPLKHRWLCWMAENGANLTVAVEAMPGRDELCYGANQLAVAIGSLVEFYSKSTPFAGALFSGREIQRSTDFKVVVAQAADSLSECEWVTRMQLEDHEEKGQFFDSAIITRRPEDYVPMLLSAGKRLSVPYMTQYSVSLAEIGICRFLQDLLATAQFSRPEALAHLMLSSYTGMERTQAESWSKFVESILGYSNFWDRLIEPDPQRAEPEFIKPLAELAQISHERCSEEEWWTKISFFLERVWIERSISLDDSATAERDRKMLKLWKDQIEVKRQILFDASVTPEQLSFDEFYVRLKGMLSSLSTIIELSPEGARIVRSSSGLGEVECVYVLGMLEGIFPKRRTADPILSDQERDQLSGVFMLEHALPNSYWSARTEREEFLRICASAKKKIVFVYPQTEGDRDNVPAFYLQEIKRVVGENMTQLEFARTDLTPIGEECIASADQVLQRALASPWTAIPPITVESPEATSILSIPPETPQSIDALRDALSCRFLYTFKRAFGVKKILGVTPRTTTRFLAQQGLVFQAKTRQEALESLHRALDAEIEHQRLRLNPDALSLMRAQANREIENFVDREFLSRELWQIAQEADTANLSFGDQRLPAEISFGSTQIVLSGRISGLSIIDERRVAHIYGARSELAKENFDALSEEAKFQIGLHLMSLLQTSKRVGLLVDDMRERRTLYIFDTNRQSPLANQLGKSVSVVRLGDPKEFYTGIKDQIRAVASGLQEGSLMPNPADHCQFCDYGELCRRSLTFGEREDIFGVNESA